MLKLTNSIEKTFNVKVIITVHLACYARFLVAERKRIHSYLIFSFSILTERQSQSQGHSITLKYNRTQKHSVCRNL